MTHNKQIKEETENKQKEGKNKTNAKQAAQAEMKEAFYEELTKQFKTK